MYDIEARKLYERVSSVDMGATSMQEQQWAYIEGLMEVSQIPPEAAYKCYQDIMRVLAVPVKTAQKLVIEILSSTIGKVKISQIVTDHELYAKHYQEIDSAGIAMTDDRPGPRRLTLADKRMMFVAPNKLKTKILIESDWLRMDWDSLLLRISGSHRRQRTLNNRREWGIEIPMHAIGL